MRSIRLFAALVCFACLSGAAPRAFAQAQFMARLAGAGDAPAVATRGQGSACLTLTSAGLQFFLTVEGLTGAVAQAHIHTTAQGSEGAIVRDITASFSGNTARGLWTATDTQPLSSALIAALLAGDLYFDVHTRAHPEGEVRGPIELSAGTPFATTLRGIRNHRASDQGTGAFTLTDQGLTFRITATGLTGAITRARMGSGTDGPAEIDLLPFFTGSTASGTVALTTEQRRRLLSGELHVSVGTAANGTGELRGPIILAGGFGLSAHLAAGAQVPPVRNAGVGSAALTLTPAGLVIDLTANGLAGPVWAAHVHRGAAGTNGPVVRTLTRDFMSGTTAVALWGRDDVEPLTPELISDLLAGNLYIDLHPATGDGGVRGQIVLNHPSATNTTTLSARITGAQAEPPIAVAALGTGTFRLTRAGLAFDVTVDRLSGPITAALIHGQGSGADGRVVRDLTPDFGTGTSAAGIWKPADAQPLTNALIAELLQGNLYFSARTAAHPAEEVRGRILPASGAGLMARLSGREGIQPSRVAGQGTASGVLTPEGLAFTITVDGLTGPITAARFRQGPPGAGGAVVREITADFAGNSARGMWKAGDAQPLTPALVTALLTGNVYVDVSTAAYPGGEIRGQLRLAGGEGRGTSLAGGGEVPPVSTLGTGSASLTLTDQGLVFRLSANDLSGPLTMAHIHQASFGANGPAVRDIDPEFTRLTADGVWKPNDPSGLTPALLGAVVRNEICLNLRTASFGAGEIRGQAGAQSITSVDPPDAVSGNLGLVNFPNPFGDRTEFSFWLPAESRIDLAIFDLAGRRVATVTRGGYSPGLHREAFNARGLRTGLYVYRLEAGSYREGGKLLIVR